ncbi:MAG: hypothetical protein KDB53_12205, partial [Planctomycetes bacterium]|nr:hypothetical protein [Planctomycetota bacterium]
ETEAEALETWRYWREHPEEMQLSLYTGTFSLGPEVPVFHRPEEYGVKIVYQENGYARCVPLDGVDWDKDPLHTAFHVRSDIEVTICGAGLLYAAHYPERLYELRAVNIVGPTSHDAPPILERALRVAPESSVLPLVAELDGVAGHRGFVAESLRTFVLDDGDVALMKAVGSGPRRGSDLVSSDDAAAMGRLARLIDRGFLESDDPASQDIEFLGREIKARQSPVAHHR